MKKKLFVSIILFGMALSVYAKDVTNLTKACANGDSKKCYKLGHLYRDGVEVKRNYFSSVKYYSKACNDDYAEACTNLGVRYLNGQGTKEDRSEAKKFFTKACNDGDSDGCHNLGVRPNYRHTIKEH